jgi:hypothetical protein
MHRLNVSALGIQLDALVIGHIESVSCDVTKQRELAVVFDEVLADSPLHPM